MTRSALVLGGGGFLGSHLIRRLLADEWRVTALVRDERAPHVVARLGALLDDVVVIEGDAADPELLARLVVGVDAIFPLAGHSGAASSMHEPLVDATANALGHLAVLEAMRTRNRDARVVFPGSRLQYGRVSILPVPESHPQHPTSIYGLHKQLGEGYHRLYAEQHGIRTCALRISNPYGPHQDRADRAFGVVGTFLGHAARNEPITLFGGGRQRRDYVYVDDLVDLLVLAVTHDDAVGRVFNASGPVATTVREMAEAVVRTVGSGSIVDAPWPATEGAIETGDYVGDLSLVGATLGWRPRVALDEGLTATWAAMDRLLVA